MLGLVIWRHYLVLFGWCCSPPTPNLVLLLHDQSRSSTKHLIEIHSVTSDNRENCTIQKFYEILKILKVPDKKYPEEKLSGRKSDSDGDNAGKRKYPPPLFLFLSMCILVLRYSYLLPITNFHRIKNSTFILGRRMVFQDLTF